MSYWSYFQEAIDDATIKKLKKLHPSIAKASNLVTRLCSQDINFTTGETISNFSFNSTYFLLSAELFGAFRPSVGAVQNAWIQASFETFPFDDGSLFPVGPVESGFQTNNIFNAQFNALQNFSYSFKPTAPIMIRKERWTRLKVTGTVSGGGSTDVLLNMNLEILKVADV